MRKIEFGNIGALPLVALLALGLTACGGGDGAFDGTPDATTDTTDTTGAPDTGAITGTAKEITVSYPQSNAIEDLQNGFYRRKAAVMVTDRDGNAVPDGTVVTLNVIDTIIAQGTIDAAGDSISGNTLIDTGVTLGDGVTAIDMDQAAVTRHGEVHTIETGDLLFLLNPDPNVPTALGADVSRTVDRNGITATSINVGSAYVGSYPDATYAAGNTRYVVGASMLGVEVSGVDSDDNLTSGAAATVNGIASFVITYPSKPEAIMTGCPGVPAIDARTAPLGAARVYVVAQVNGQPEVTVVSDDFCFARIAGGTLTPFPTSISSSVFPTGFSVEFRDGGDAMVVPYAAINASVDNSGGAGISLDASVYITDLAGYIYPQIVSATGASGDTATIAFSVAGEPSTKTTVKYTIP